MEENNLVYFFLDSGFTDCKDREITRYAYDKLPDYYLKTYEYNKTKFIYSHFITNNGLAETLLVDSDYKIVDDILNTKWYRYKKNPFWYNTFIRVILLCLYVRNNNLRNVIHVEADNIIFGNNEHLKSLTNMFKEGEFGFSNEAPFSSAPSFIFIKDKEAANNLLHQHIKLLEKGEDTLRPYVGHYGNYITDMAFLDIIFRHRKGYKMLPCLPFGQQSENFAELNCVFDPTSYGQYIGGTNNGHPPGFIDPTHYIGQEIINKNINIQFNSNIPHLVTKDGTLVSIFNLHVHNKKAIESLIE